MSEQAPESFQEPSSEGEETQLDLIYKIQGNPNEFDVFELSGVLSAFGNVLKESYRITHPGNGELTVKVKPFESGSFIMDIVLAVKQDAGFLFLLSHPEILKYARDSLEAIGLSRR